MPMTWQQGLTGYAPQTTTLQPGLMSTMGPWSQLAYQMAGSPRQGGLWPSVPVPTATGAISAGGGQSTGQSILGGLLGIGLRNPNLISGAIGKVGGLLGLGGNAADTAASVGDSLSGLTGAGGASAYGTSAGVAPASALTSELPATATGTYGVTPAVSAASATAPAGVTTGLLGAGAPSIGAGAPGVFATGNAAAGSAGTGAGLSVSPAVGFAAPLAAAALPFMLGMGAAGKSDQGDAAMRAWMNATGATFRPSPGNTNSGQSTFGGTSTGNSWAANNVNPGTWLDASGNAMTAKQAETALVQWARAHGIPTGDLNYMGG